MSVNEMRERLKYAPKYQLAKAWWDKVDHMSDKQVIAVYYRMLRAGELDET